MKSQVGEGMQRLVGRLWEEFVDGWTPESAIRSNPAARRAIEAGADPADVAQALKAAAWSAVFGTLNRIDAGRDPDAHPAAPGWKLIEVSGGLPTGRDLTGLDEAFLMHDPTGRAGADLWR